MEKEILFGNPEVQDENPAVSEIYQQERSAPGNEATGLWRALSEAKQGTTRDMIASLTKRFIRW